MGRVQPRARSREYARCASTAVSTPAARSDARKSSQDDPRGPTSGSVTDGPECGSTVLTGPTPYRIATDAVPTVEFPLKLPISRTPPPPHSHPAPTPTTRASLSATIPALPP